jgi:PIN domain nuclease of toxin-antitoxin system
MDRPPLLALYPSLLAWQVCTQEQFGPAQILMNLYPKNSGRATHEVATGHAHVYLVDSEPARLSPQALALCQDRQNVLLLSVVSIWEMQIKLQLGKLRLALPLKEIIETQQQTNNIEILPVTLAHVLALENLPVHHKDPFDRLLVAQAMVEGAVLVSGDPNIAKYAVQVVW